MRTWFWLFSLQGEKKQLSLLWKSRKCPFEWFNFRPPKSFITRELLIWNLLQAWNVTFAYLILNGKNLPKTREQLLWGRFLFPRFKNVSRWICVEKKSQDSQPENTSDVKIDQNRYFLDKATNLQKFVSRYQMRYGCHFFETSTQLGLKSISRPSPWVSCTQSYSVSNQGIVKTLSEQQGYKNEFDNQRVEVAPPPSLPHVQ